jgi:hypothetical protein
MSDTEDYNNIISGDSSDSEDLSDSEQTLFFQECFKDNEYTENVKLFSIEEDQERFISKYPTLMRGVCLEEHENPGAKINNKERYNTKIYLTNERLYADSYGDIILVFNTKNLSKYGTFVSDRDEWYCYEPFEKLLENAPQQLVLWEERRYITPLFMSEWTSLYNPVSPASIIFEFDNTRNIKKAYNEIEKVYDPFGSIKSNKKRRL